MGKNRLQAPKRAKSRLTSPICNLGFSVIAPLWVDGSKGMHGVVLVTRTPHGLFWEGCRSSSFISHQIYKCLDHLCPVQSFVHSSFYFI